MKLVKDFLKVNEKDLKTDFFLAMKDEKFETLRNTIKLSDDVLCRYTSRLQDSSIELNNCVNCKGLNTCKNCVNGYIYLPTINDNNLSFDYKPCKYKEKYDKLNNYKKNIDLFDVPSILKNASFRDIYTDDKSRIDVIKYIDSYYKKYFTNDKDKGLYLYGNFGCGKTYILAALLNELAKKTIKSSIIYFPEFLRTLKASFTKGDEGELTFSEKFEYIKKVPVLLIDDIGAENVTAWSRDEILGTLLQYRMEENLATFLTSNLSLDELEIHLSISGQRVEKVKARRIIERIKFLTNDMKLVGADRRK